MIHEDGCCDIQIEDGESKARMGSKLLRYRKQLVIQPRRAMRLLFFLGYLLTSPEAPKYHKNCVLCLVHEALPAVDRKFTNQQWIWPGSGLFYAHGDKVGQQTTDRVGAKV